MTSYNTDHKVVIGGRTSLLTKHGQEMSLDGKYILSGTLNMANPNQIGIKNRTND